MSRILFPIIKIIIGAIIVLGGTRGMWHAEYSWLISVGFIAAYCGADLVVSGICGLVDIITGWRAERARRPKQPSTS